MVFVVASDACLVHVYCLVVSEAGLVFGDFPWFIGVFHGFLQVFIVSAWF